MFRQVVYKCTCSNVPIWKFKKFLSPSTVINSIFFNYFNWHNPNQYTLLLQEGHVITDYTSGTRRRVDLYKRTTWWEKPAPSNLEYKKCFQCSTLKLERWLLSQNFYSQYSFYFKDRGIGFIRNSGIILLNSLSLQMRAASYFATSIPSANTYVFTF